ncbi:hydrogenase formation protein HypD [Candidatus Dependentiae bacterium]|nr:hydrogenase formation protein HypD [Candidatus Dependentiae bacterium]
MDLLDKFRDKNLVLNVIKNSNKLLDDIGQVNFMEVCGTHTVEIFKFGIKKLFNNNLNLISGPGCPVCVTGNRYLDTAIALSRRKDVIITTFGDMMRVPGSTSSLIEERSAGAEIKVLYSARDSLKIASDNPDKKVVFLGVGFETTAPTIASTVKLAEAQNINNFYVLTAHKTMPNAMAAILASEKVKINGFICPGHVSTITGIHIYDFIPEQFSVPCVVSGFEPLDIVQSIYSLCKQLYKNIAIVENTYSRVVRENGNQIAQQILVEVFEESDEDWRGIGIIPGSGLKFCEEYSRFDAFLQIPVDVEETIEPEGCRCGEVLRGIITPLECPLFKNGCSIDHPIGACMVSSEGTCAAYFKYHIEERT